jgi:hypothetical protein
MTLTTKYIRATRSNIAYTLVYVDNILKGQYWALPKGFSWKYAACAVNGSNQSFNTVDECINFLGTIELNKLLYISLAGVQVLQTNGNYTTIAPDTTTLTHYSLKDAMYLADNYEVVDNDVMGIFDKAGDAV